MANVKTKIRRSKVQTRRLKAAIEMMEDVAKNRREQFDMAYYKRCPSGFARLCTEEPNKRFLSDCSTAACFAGWLTESDEYRKAMKFARVRIGGELSKYTIRYDGAPNFGIGPYDFNSSVGKVLSKYFGISVELAEKVSAMADRNPVAEFYGIPYNPNEHSYKDLCRQITPEMVIEKLKMILNGELQ